ncbi:ABC transporter permease [bacterium]|nr:ABC transporter permease [bacterium]
MRTSLIIAWQALKIMAQNKAVLVWTLLIPCLYIFIFGNAFKQGDPSDSRAYLAVHDRDGGRLSERLIASLKTENIILEVNPDSTKRNLTRELTIPAGFTEKLLSGKRDTLNYHKRADSNIEADMNAELAVRRAAYRLVADMAELRVKGKALQPARFAELDSSEALIRVNASFAGRYASIPSGFSQQVPSNIVQFVLLIIFIYAGSMVFEERQSGLLKRIRTAPVGYFSLFTGKLGGSVLIGIVQCLLLLFIGRFVFGVHYGHSPAALVLTILLYVMTVSAMGLCLGFMVKNSDKLLGLAIVSALIMAALSGCWWPIEITPPWAQKIALLLPSGLALKSLHFLISFGRGFETVWPYLLAQAGFAAGFTLLFARILSRTSFSNN